MNIRQTDKLDRYIEMLMKQYPMCTVSPGLKSRYYTIGDKVLRVSDHIGTHSDAYVSIIVPSFKSNDNQYIIHAHNCGQISVLDYEKTKELVRSFFYLSSIFSETSVTRTEVTGEGEKQAEEKNVNKLIGQISELKKYKDAATSKSKTILGVPLDQFSKGQLETIQNMVNKIIKKTAV